MSEQTTQTPKETKVVEKKPKKKIVVPRLYVRGKILSYRRSLTRQYSNRNIVKLQDVNTKEDAEWYLGKRVAYVYRAKNAKKSQRLQGFKVNWGTILKTHGNNGAVQVRFQTNLSPEALGKPCRVYLYPSRI